MWGCGKSTVAGSNFRMQTAQRRVRCCLVTGFRIYRSFRSAPELVVFASPGGSKLSDAGTVCLSSPGAAPSCLSAAVTLPLCRGVTHPVG